MSTRDVCLPGLVFFVDVHGNYTGIHVYRKFFGGAPLSATLCLKPLYSMQEVLVCTVCGISIIVFSRASAPLYKLVAMLYIY